MGFYDCRCMVSGVSLKGADAALVLLHQADSGHVPLALAIKGNYNRLGSIDGIEEDANTRLVLRYFLEGLQTGVFTIDEEYLRGHRCFPITTIEDLLQGFERNINDGDGVAVLNRQSVVFALIARSVWDALARSTPDSNSPIFPFVLNSLNTTIYERSVDEVGEHLREFAAVQTYLKSRGIPWRVTAGEGQDFAEEMRQYLTEARQAFADSPDVLAGLEGYEREVAHLLDDE